MLNPVFKFKQFSIMQNKAAMKVGTDGVLLGAWANGNMAHKILDIGTGTGLIALMLAQRTKAQIDALEIDHEASEEAKDNVRNAIWNERITIINQSFQTFAQSTDNTYDLIVSNPPYFSKSEKAANEGRTRARHDDSLPMNELFMGVKKLLSNNGIFAIIIPSDNYINYLAEAEKWNIFPSKALWIKPTPNKEAKRVLLEFSYLKQSLTKDCLIIEDKGRHGYSDAYKNLTKDFYLAF